MIQYYFLFFCPIFPQAVSCPCKVKFTFLFSHLFATLFCLGNISLLFFLGECYIQFLVFKETVALRPWETENKNWVLSNELIKVELPLWIKGLESWHFECYIVLAVLIQGIVLYPLESTVQPLNNSCQKPKEKHSCLLYLPLRLTKSGDTETAAECLHMAEDKLHYMFRWAVKKLYSHGVKVR